MTRKTGSITERSPGHWRIGYDGEIASGARKQIRVTFRGTKREAEKELRRLLTEKDRGVAVDPSRLTVTQYLDAWLAEGEGLSPKTLERYRQLVRIQITPHLGAVKLQQLRPAQVADWLTTLSKTGLAARTIGHARRVLHAGIARAVRREEVNRNVVSAMPAPKVDQTEIEICRDVPALFARLADRPLYILAATALATGARRGELLALSWSAVDLEKGLVRVERALEETAAGIRFKEPKSRAGRRVISIPESTVLMLRKHRVAQRAAYLKAAIRPAEDLVFARGDGEPWSPDGLSRDWARSRLGCSFHALRHTHASALIAAGLDPVAVSRRLGHADASITLRVYSHLFDAGRTDELARAAIGRVLG